MKKLLIFVSFFLTFIQISSPVFSQENHPKIITFINQVRGGECCDPGSIDNLNFQLDSFNKHNLSATFAIRYDALKNDQITSTLKNTNHQIAGLLEIIPSLANDSKVSYSGNQENWYLSKHAFLVGYQIPERIKLIDTYMSKFKDVFGAYPTTTSSWMIDSCSLNYLQDKYHITVHQITRDQWGTDTYTLYGGPFHYPYYASSNWPLIPGNSKILMVRQTVADPLYNYADHTASHTSQPNDYLQNKNFTYFTNLLTQTLNQTHNQYSFALLGLENNMNKEFQQEYAHQISWIKDFKNNNPNTQIVKASDLPNLLPKQSTSIINGKDLVSNNNYLESFHINSNNYSARLLRKDNNIFITDFRIYSEIFSNITAVNKSPTNNTYWITPFIIDSSRMIPSDTSAPTGLVEKITNIIYPKLPKYPAFNPIPDYKSDLTLGIKLPDIIKNGAVDISSQIITYQNNSKELVEISIQEDLITINQPNSATIVGNQNNNTPFSTFPQIIKADNTLSWDNIYKIQIDSTNENTTITPIISENNNINVADLSLSAFYPDLINNQTNIKNSFTIPHNKVALVSQNPIRIFIFPISQDGLPTTNKNISVSSNNSEDKIDIHLPYKNTDMTWADIFSNSSGNRIITTRINDQQIDIQSVYFAPNCKSNFKSCLKNPQDMIMYIYYQLINVVKNIFSPK